jgi:type IV pilus assembly protein PilM
MGSEKLEGGRINVIIPTMSLLSLKENTFGLDFSDLSLKAAELKRRGKFFKLKSWACQEIKPGVIEEGIIRDRKETVKAIKKLVVQAEKRGLRSDRVVASLPEKKAFLQVIRMPKMEEKELSSAVPFEAENYIPLPLDRVYLDFQLIPSSDKRAKHSDVLIAALPKDTVDPYVDCLKKAGLSPRALEVESQSISRALIKGGYSSYPVLIVDFGRSNTSFIIYSGFSLRFTSSVSISSQKITDKISDALGVNSSVAEKLKIKYGLFPEKEKIKGKRISRKKYVSATESAAKELQGQIKRYADYYQSHTKKNGGPVQSIKKVVFCGRGANLKGFADYLSLSLKIPVELGNPWVNILPEPLKEVPGLSFEESLGYTTALGLALRNQKYD